MELVKIETSKINDKEVQTVNARELHEFLESKQDFSNWIRNRIEDFGFIEGQDFTIILLKTSNGGRPRNEYFLSLSMAKELSMVERNEKGKQARQYFIKCEEIAKNKPVLNLDDPSLLKNLLLDNLNKVITLEHQVKEQNDQIESLQSLFQEGMTVVAFCKGLNGVNTQKVNEYLLIKKWLYSDNGWRVGNYARDKYLTEKIAHEYTDSKGVRQIKYKQELLRKGAQRLHQMYIANELPMKKDWNGVYTHDKYAVKEVA